jgi:K+-sensing histidine kinase KdpD
MRPSPRFWSKDSLRSLDRTLRYGCAAVCLLIAFVLRNELGSLVEDRVPFMFFAPAAIVAAWIGGFGPGIVALLVGIFLGQYFFVSPYDSILPSTEVGLLLLAPYVVTTLLAICFIHAWQRASRERQEFERLAQMHVESLKEQVVERKRVEELLRQATSGPAGAFSKSSTAI